MSSYAKQLVKDLKKTLFKLELEKNRALQNLNEDQLKEIAPITADFSRVMQATKEGNTEELNKYVAKYANIN